MLPSITAIRNNDSKAKISAPGLYSSVNFLVRVLNRTCDLIDIVSFHTYQGNTVASRMAKLEELVSISNTHCGKEIWVTEFGFKTPTVSEENQGSLITGVFEQAILLPNVTKVFQYAMAENINSNSQHGIVVMNYLTNEFNRYKEGFEDVKAYVTSLHDSFNLDSTIQLSYFNHDQEKVFLELNDNSPEQYIYFDPTKKISLRTKTAPAQNAVCEYNINGASTIPTFQCDPNHEYIFSANSINEAIDYRIDINNFGQISSKIVHLNPTRKSNKVEFAIRYWNHQGQQKIRISDYKNPFVFVDDIDRHKKIEFKIITTPLEPNSQCSFKSPTGNGSCATDYIYEFEPGHFSEHFYFNLVIEASGQKHIRKIQW